MRDGCDLNPWIFDAGDGAPEWWAGRRAHARAYSTISTGTTTPPNTNQYDAPPPSVRPGTAPQWRVVWAGFSGPDIFDELGERDPTTKAIPSSHLVPADPATSMLAMGWAEPDRRKRATTGSDIKRQAGSADANTAGTTSTSTATSPRHNTGHCDHGKLDRANWAARLTATATGQRTATRLPPARTP